jgi:hypothetical protein
MKEDTYSEWVKRLSQSKRAMREALANLHIDEKIKIVEDLRDRPPRR